MPRPNKSSPKAPKTQTAVKQKKPPLPSVPLTERTPHKATVTVNKPTDTTDKPTQPSEKKRRIPRTRHFTDPKFKTTRQLYDFIEARMREEGRSAPTLAQMGRFVHMSPSGVSRHLDRLEAWGWIQREPNRAREIVLLRRKREP